MTLEDAAVADVGVEDEFGTRNAAREIPRAWIAASMSSAIAETVTGASPPNPPTPR